MDEAQESFSRTGRLCRGRRTPPRPTSPTTTSSTSVLARPARPRRAPASSRPARLVPRRGRSPTGRPRGGALRRRARPPGLPRPAPERERPPAGLARQRRDDPQAAGRHRRDLRVLCPAQLEHPPGRPHARSALDGSVRGWARGRAPLPQRADQGRHRLPRGTTEAINLVAASYGGANVGPGDEIILSTIEHHANIVPWQLLAQRTGATIRVIPVNDAARSSSSNTPPCSRGGRRSSR